MRRPALGWLLDWVARGTLYLHLCTFSIYYITDMSVALRVSQLLGVLAFAIESSRYLPSYRPVYWILLVTGSAYIVKLIAFGTGDLDVLVYLVMGAGFAMVVYRQTLDSRIVWAIYAAVLAYFGSALVQGLHPLFTMETRSYNHISVMGISFGVLLTLIGLRREEPAPFLPAVTTFLLCLWGMGRSGILAAGLLLAGVLIMRRSVVRTSAFWGVSTVFVAVGVWLVRRSGLPVVEFISQSTWKFAERGFGDAARSEILRVYLGSLDGRTLLLGHEAGIIDTLRLTLHNSFLLWHFNFGIAALVLLIISAVALWRCLPRRPAYALCLSVILLRAATDTVLYPGPFLDFLFLYIIMIAISRTEADRDHRTRPTAASERESPWTAAAQGAV